MPYWVKYRGNYYGPLFSLEDARQFAKDYFIHNATQKPSHLHPYAYIWHGFLSMPMEKIERVDIHG